MTNDVADFTNYLTAQKAIAELKVAVLNTIYEKPGLTNAQVGRTLGIYMGHKRHEGHISRTLLELLENEGLIEQKSDKTWHPRRNNAK